MSRIVRDKKVYIKPVKKIELDESNVKLRFIAVVAMIIIAATAFGFGIYGLVNGKGGWINAECVMSEPNCSGDFAFTYYSEGKGETKSVEALYSKSCVDAYAIFSDKERFNDVNNLWKLNNEPNTEIELPKVLYNALLETVDNGNLYIYLGPLYNESEALCMSEDDAEADQFNPLKSETEREFYDNVLKFVTSGKDIELRFLGNNRVMLFVSKAYADFAESCGGLQFIGFGHMKNAFVIDYIAEEMLKGGFTKGCLSSFDGYSRCLDESGLEFSYNLFDMKDQKVVFDRKLTYKGRRSIVLYRTYPVTDLDRIHYYTYSDGTVMHPYLDLPGGKMTATTDTMCCYSDTLSCSEIMLKTVKNYIEGEDIADETDITVIRP